MNILAVGAHWDDIELGCFCTLRRMSSLGHQVFCVVTCSAYYEISGGHKGMGEEEAREQGEKAFALFGGKYIDTPKAANQRLTYSRDTMQQLERIAAEHRIDAVFTHWHGDLNTDHVATWQNSRTAFRRVPNLYMYQSNSYSDYVDRFQPNAFFGFPEKEYEVKKQALAQYDKEWQYRESRWQGEIFDREKYWGYLAGHDYAEAFQACKTVNHYLSV
jgi:LmbE family N-acetylglucosaminyl deacetylase